MHFRNFVSIIMKILNYYANIISKIIFQKVKKNHNFRKNIFKMLSRFTYTSLVSQIPCMTFSPHQHQSQSHQQWCWTVVGWRWSTVVLGEGGIVVFLDVQEVKKKKKQKKRCRKQLPTKSIKLLARQIQVLNIDIFYREKTKVTYKQKQNVNEFIIFFKKIIFF